MNKIERVWGINSKNRRGKCRYDSKLVLSIWFLGITLPNFLLDEEKFKFLVHSEDGKPWLAGSERKLAKLVEDITKAGGFYPDGSFTVLTNIAVQCQGGDKWKFSNSDGSARLPSQFREAVNVEKDVIIITLFSNLNASFNECLTVRVLLVTPTHFSFSSLDVQKHLHK